LITIRASSVPLLLACPPALAADPAVDADSPHARLGTAVHDGLSRLIGGSPVAASDLARVHGIPDAVDEISMLLHFGRQAWAELGSRFPSPSLEQSIDADLGEGVRLTGHPDVLSPAAEDGALAVLDWKTGRKQKDFFDQLAAYGILGAACYGIRPRWVDCTVVWLRERSYETVRLDIGDLERTAVRIRQAAAQTGGNRYSISEHCDYCPRRCDCPARAALVRQTVRDVAGFNADTIAALGDRLPEVYAGVRCLEKACADFRDALKSHIREAGPIQAGGRRYELKDYNRRRLIPVPAWKVLSAHLTDEELAPAVSISVTRALDAVGKKAGRGRGKAAKQQVESDLQAAGAIVEEPCEPRLTESDTDK
jgi:RecB family exonuclease